MNHQPHPDHRRLATGGSMLIPLIVMLLIMSVLGAAMVSLTSTASHNQVLANSTSRALYLAESGARYAIACIRANAGDAVTLHGRTFTLANGDRFTLGVDNSAAPEYTITVTVVVSDGTPFQGDAIFRFDDGLRVARRTLFDFGLFGETGVHVGPNNEVYGDVGTNSSAIDNSGTITGASDVSLAEVLAPYPPPNGGTNLGVVDLKGSSVLTLGAGTYYNSGSKPQDRNFSMSGQSTLRVTGDAELVVAGDFIMDGLTSLEILPEASLKLYVSGAIKINSNRLINSSMQAANFQMYGGSATIDVDFTGGNALYAVVYVPEGRVRITGSTVFHGCIIAEDINMVGNAEIHYDPSIIAAGLATGGGYPYPLRKHRVTL